MRTCYQTQLLKNRISGHVSDRNNLNKLRSAVVVDNSLYSVAELERFSGKNAIIKHIIEHSHEFDYDSTKVLSMDGNLVKLKFLELLHIQHLNTVNLKSDVDGLHVVYSGLLSKVRSE